MFSNNDTLCKIIFPLTDERYRNPFFHLWPLIKWHFQFDHLVDAKAAQFWSQVNHNDYDEGCQNVGKSFSSYSPQIFPYVIRPVSQMSWHRILYSFKILTVQKTRYNWEDVFKEKLNFCFNKPKVSSKSKNRQRQMIFENSQTWL